jgi:hypothetical protein
MKTFIVGVAVAMSMSGHPAACDQSPAPTAEHVLRENFDDSKYWPLGSGESDRIEFCGGDWCQEVQFKTADAKDAAWDALFLMFYYFEPIPSFQSTGAEVASSLLEKSGACSQPDSRAKAGCVLQVLQREYGLTYRRVQYDVGSRCWSEFRPVSPYFTNLGDCGKIDAQQD